MDGRCWRVRNVTRGTEVAGRVRVARSFRERLRGLLGSAPLRPGEGLLLYPCRGVHTFFMRYSVDVLFLDGQGRVTALSPGLPPWRARTGGLRATCALELAEGTIGRSRTEEGDVLAWEETVG